MNRAFAKSERIVQVERLLLRSRASLTQAEIVRDCEVHRSTIGRLIESMLNSGIPVRYDNVGRVSIERTAYITMLQLKFHEAVALFLAGRLLACYSDNPNVHTVETLDKCGVVLQGVMPVLGQHMTTTSTTVRARLPKQISDYQRMVEKLTEAWAQGTKVQRWYRPLHIPVEFNQPG